MNTIRIPEKKGVEIIAHRGLSGIELENTISSFVAAGNRNYFGIETDVHATKDGKLVIIHDDETGRVSEENLSVDNSMYDDLKKVSLGLEKNGTKRIDRKIPDLIDYIKICKTYEKSAVLELKNHMSKKTIVRSRDNSHSASSRKTDLNS